MAKKTIPLNLMLDPNEKERLSRLADYSGFTMSVVVRQLITNSFNMIFLNAPTCASGKQCPFPAAHSPANMPELNTSGRAAPSTHSKV